MVSGGSGQSTWTGMRTWAVHRGGEGGRGEERGARFARRMSSMGCGRVDCGGFRLLRLEILLAVPTGSRVRLTEVFELCVWIGLNLQAMLIAHTPEPIASIG